MVSLSPSDGGNPEESPELVARRLFLIQQEKWGRAKYGEKYQEAADIIAAKADPALIQRIQWADDPADMLIREAERIAEEETYGSDPGARVKAVVAKMKPELEKEIRAQVLKEFNIPDKIKARANQPLDMGKVRSGGERSVEENPTRGWDLPV